MNSQEGNTSQSESRELPTRMLGRTGRDVSIIGLGGGSLLMKTENRNAAVEMVNHAIDSGINYIDTAPSYNNSEQYIGEVMKHRRDQVFLATKVDPRTRDEAWQSIEESLERLQTDVIDLIQVHDIQTFDDVNAIMRHNGAVTAMIEALEQGLVRWIGVTGHGDPAAMAYALERFDFDTVLMPVNVTDRHYRSYIDTILPFAGDRDIGAIGMKVFCAGEIFETLETSVSEALRYTLSFPISTAIIGFDNLQHLDEIVDIARNFKPMDESEQQRILDRTRDKAAACNAKFKE